MNTTLPPFTERGLLPPGIYWTTWSGMYERFGFSERRRHLLQGLALALEMFREAGCQQFYLDGSFVTAKEQPRDYDACWDPEGMDFGRIDRVLLDYSNKRAAQKNKYGGEFFLAKLPSGVSGMAYLDFFQTDRETGERKGIVALNPRRLR